MNSTQGESDSPRYYIASLKHTENHHEHVTWWAKDRCGYTPVIGDYTGTYGHEEAMRLNDGIDCMAVPVSLIADLQAPEPYWKPGARLYDQRGPVVENSRENWRQLIAGCRPERAPKPRVFRGRRRAIAWAPEVEQGGPRHEVDRG